MEVKKNEMAFLGKNVEFFMMREDFSKILKDSDLPTSLVNYHKASNIVTCDSRAEDWYVKYAGLHEAVCCGSYGSLVPRWIFRRPTEVQKFLNIHGVSGRYDIRDVSDRCGVIDLLIIEQMPKTLQRIYLKRRIEMFRTLLSRKLYGDDEDLRKSFERALELLDVRLKNN